MLLSTLILAGLGNTLVVTSCDARLWGWTAAAIGTYVVVLYVPPAACFFALEPLALQQWGLALSAAAVAVLIAVMTGRRSNQVRRAVTKVRP